MLTKTEVSELQALLVSVQQQNKKIASFIRKITMPFTMADTLSANENMKEMCIQAVVNVTKVEREAILNINTKSRKQNIVKARHYLRALLKLKTSYSLKEIGWMTGKSDHSCVINSQKTIYNWIATDPAIKNEWNQILNELI